MKKLVLLASALCITAGVASAQNLLSNSDFNIPGDGSSATDWEAWSWGNGWANTEISDPDPVNGWGVAPPDGYHIAVGAAGGGGGGYHQTVPGAAGISYTLSVMSGADNWWLPTGTMEMFFLDASTNVISSAARNTVDPAVYGEDQFDILHPWESYSLSATSPAGTTQVKVEFAANNATGSVGFDLAELVVPEPTTAGLFAVGSLLLFGYRSHRKA